MPKTATVHPSGDKRFKILDATMKRHQHQPDSLIEVLHKAQELFGCLETDVLFYVARSLKLPPSRVYGVATFYHLFSLKPQGEHVCTVCLGTACFVKGAGDIVAALEKRAHIRAGETTKDGKLSLLSARCAGFTPRSRMDWLKGWRGEALMAVQSEQRHRRKDIDPRDGKRQQEPE